MHPLRNALFGRLSAHMSEFAAETGVFGFNLFCFALSTTETIFWCLCTTLFICFTIRDVVALSLSFLSEDTVTLTSKIANSTIVLDPPPTFGVSHGFEGLLDFRPTINESRLDAMLVAFLNEFDSSAAENVSLVEVEPEFFQFLTAMLRDVIKSEIEILFPEQTLWGWSLEYKDATTFQPLRSMTKAIYNRLRNAGVDFSELLRFLAAKICRSLDLTVYYPDSHERRLKAVEMSPCEPRNMLLLDFRHIYFRTSQNPVTFSGFTDYFFISWNADTRRAPPTIYFDVAGTSLMTWQTEDSDATLKLTYNKVNEVITASTRISGAYHMEETKRSRPCSPSESRYDCKQRCYIDEFVKRCGCYPVYFAAAYERPQTANVRACPYNLENGDVADEDFVPHLRSCVKLNRTANLDDCIERCLLSCYSKTFTNTVDRLKQRVKEGDDFYELELNVRSFVFPLFEEKLAMGFDSFMSQFGGVLGLYLGISFAALVHIPIFVVRKLLRVFGRQSRRNERSTFDVGTVDLELQSRRTSNISLVSSTGRPDMNDERVLQRLDAIDKRFERMEDVLRRVYSRLK